MKNAAALQTILTDDPWRRDVLAAVRSLALPDCWVGAGFIRNAVWDYLHDRPPSRHAGDVDVIWFCPKRARPENDREAEAALRALDPAVDWSVKNQARMHLRNGDASYASAIEEGSFEIAAPFGLGDLFDLILRPTPSFAGEKRRVYLDRIESKRWLTIWPRLRIMK